jgi:hypothetical protein
MIITILIIALILYLAPYLMYGWLFGATLVKKLLEKEWRKEKGLLSAYERLSSEDRMELDLKRTKISVKDEPLKNESAWLGAPTPRQENVERNEKVFKEGLIETPPEGKWETPQDIEPKKQTSQPARVA